MDSAEEFLIFGVLFAVILSVLMFLMFDSSFSAALPIGCNNNNVLENQFTSAEYGYPNRMEGTPLFRCYDTDACYNQATAYNTCIKHWCYYTYWTNGHGSYSQVDSCISNPSQSIKNECSVISPSNTAALESCYRSTIVANNATQIQNCDTSSPVCVAGDSKYCSACQGT
jgi:hypothetical protein